MNPLDNSDHPQLPTIKIRHPSSSFSSSAVASPTAGAGRKIGFALDLSNESAFAVLRLLLGLRGSWALRGVGERAPVGSEDDFDAFTSSKAADLAKPLKESGIPFKIHIVKDHDMKERLCLEVERLGLSAVIMGSRGFGAEKRGSDGKC